MLTTSWFQTLFLAPRSEHRMSLQSLIFPLNKKGEVWQALPFRFLPFLAWRNLPFAEAIDSNSEIFTAGPISGLAQAETGVRFPLGAPNLATNSLP